MDRGERILRGTSRFRLLPFLGPAFIAAVAYIDPGNFATHIATGSKSGHTPLSVIVASTPLPKLITTPTATHDITDRPKPAQVVRPPPSPPVPTPPLAFRGPGVFWPGIR